MKRTKLKDRVLPTYTKGEEIFNMVSHIVGGALGVITTILAIVIGAIHHNGYGIVSGIIFGISMIFLYTMSSIYHGLSPKKLSKKVMQIMDHCAIFVLIAGSYTPFALCTLREYSPALGWTIFAIIWIFAALGITLNAIDLKKYKIFSMICYLVMGWCIVFKFNLLPEAVGFNGVLLLVLGGIAYTVGTVFYVLGDKIRYMHSIWHLWILVGSILHFLCIILYVL